MARARARGVTAASIVGWSNDLLQEILVYLPVKSLLRFKLVSKKWNLIISDIAFAVNQFRKTHNSSTPSGLFLYDSWEDHKTVSLPLFQNPPGSVPPLWLPHKIPLLPIQSSRYERDFYSCNGLLLCIFSPGCLSRCAVYNPSTGDFKLLPDLPDLATPMVSYNGFTLVFNPFESHHYSVVAIRRCCTRNRPKFGSSKLYIYSSKTQCWEELSCMIRKIEPYVLHNGAFLNGTIYWIGKELMHCYNINSHQVVSLDLPSEITRFGKSSWNSYFTGGHSYIVLQLKQGFKVFEFDHVNMKWSDPHTLLVNSDTNPKARALAVVRGKENKDLLFVFSIFYDTLMIYDLVLHKLVERHALTLGGYICDYIPSLIPV